MKYSKQELEILAQPFLEQYGKEEMYATADGNIFIEQQRADQHANANGLAVYVVTKGQSTVELIISSPVLEEAEGGEAVEEQESKSKKTKKK